MIEIKNLSAGYQVRPDWTVEKVNLEVGASEILTIQGPSGSGKTTLLRAIAGLHFLDRTMKVKGEVWSDGIEVSGLTAQKRKFGLMFQQPFLFENLSVGENIGYGLYRQPKTERAKKVQELLELIELNGYENRSVRTLSGGEAQRVALARALAVQPKLMMFDEPFSALDDEIRLTLVSRVRDLLKELKVPAIFVSHRDDELQILGGKLILWRKKSIPSFA